MASESLTRFLIDLGKEPEIVEDLKHNPETVLVAAGLSDEEREIINSRDPRGFDGPFRPRSERCRWQSSSLRPRDRSTSGPSSRPPWLVLSTRPRYLPKACTGQPPTLDAGGFRSAGMISDRIAMDFVF